LKSLQLDRLGEKSIVALFCMAQKAHMVLEWKLWRSEV